jgi:putative inorganic carbon (HCO3(-)) transporter
VFVEEVTLGGITVSRLLAPLALCVLLAVAVRRRLMIGTSWPAVWAAAYSVWAFASFAWTTDIADTRFKLASLAIALVYLIVLATLIESVRDLRTVLFVLVFASVLTGAFGLATYAFGISSQLQGGRPNGGAGDPNFFALYQLIALPATLALAVSTGKRWLRIVLAVAALIIIASIFVSESRGGLLALAVVVLLVILLPARAMFYSRRQKVTLLLVLLVTGAFALGTTGAPVVGRLESVQTSDPTGSGRLDLWKAGWTSIKDRPVLGLGYGSFSAAVPQLLHETPGIDFRHLELRPDRASGAHSVYVGTLAELGIPGLALLICLLLSTLRHLVRTARKAREAGAIFVARVANAILLSLIGWAVAATFLSTETSRSLWALLAVALVLPKLIPATRRADVADVSDLET